MGHWSGIKYTFKLNKQDPSYEDIIRDIKAEIAKKYEDEQIDPGESFSASMSLKYGKLHYSSCSYKSRVSNDLSYDLIKKIEKNINTNPDIYYYYQEDNGEGSAIERLYGYAQKVGQYLLDADYANYHGSIGFYSDESIEKFHECIEDKDELDEVIKKGESKRLKREVFGDKNEINEFWIYIKKSPESKDYVLDEKLLTYWLVYGTEDKYNTSFNYYSNPRMNLKEYLYALNYKYYDTNFGIKVLKALTRYGVVFKEGIDSIEGNFKLGIRYDHSGRDISKEQIESWYQENKEPFSEVPKISQHYANYLKDKYPETFLKLKNKLIELYNTHQGLKESVDRNSSLKRK